MSSRHLSSKRSQAYGLLLLNTVLWGIAPPIIKIALNYVSIYQFLFARYLIASLIFLPIYLITRKKGHHLRHHKQLIFLALLGTPLTLIPLYEGIKLTTSIESSLLYATIPVMAVVGGWLFLKEKIEKNEQLGLLIAIIGTLLLVLEPLFSGQVGPRASSALGNLFILVSNLIWVAFLLLVKKYKTTAEDVSLVSYLISIPFFLFLIFLEPSSISNLTSQISNGYALLGILYMAIFGSIVAFWAYAKGQESIEAGEASIFTYLQPIFTLPLAIFWLHESVSLVAIVACIIIAIGVYFSEYRH